jgi:hypothetical protein
VKKVFQKYLILWAVLFVLFQVIAFVSPGWSGVEKYTASFWIGYVGITIAFVGQLACTYFALKESDLQKTFYNISLITTSYTGLILTLIFGGLCMLLSLLPYWVGTILCAAVLAFNIIAVVKAAIAIDVVNAVDDKIKTQTLFIKSLTVAAESLVTRAKGEAVKAECKKVYEAVRYSDPMSSSALDSLENEITIKFSKLSDAVSSDNSEVVTELADTLVILIGERNKKCKLLK